ncbi:nucleotidyltransferase domain-containing protein [Krasilnikovia sp. M28-CT-15]|uniref:nucleotidyltransferase domain-containing protein n=1 Tax=Krasilnikovia sp. M28-CT-15 TaxID=3373540 RepID=UPI00399CE85F
MTDGVLDVAAQEADRLVAAGAQAVVLVGSHALGTADDASDIDIVALGDGPCHETGWQGGRLLVVNWRTAAETRLAFASPDLAGIAVPAWRNVWLLRDPDSEAVALRDEARAWDWSPALHRACDRWVADRLIYLAEDVVRMAACLRRGAAALAAASAPFVTVQLTTVAVVHRRLLLRSVNDAWTATATSEGPQWTASRTEALALGGQDLLARVAAAVQMFHSTIELASPVLTAAQQLTLATTVDRARTLLAGTVYEARGADVPR